MVELSGACEKGSNFGDGKNSAGGVNTLFEHEKVDFGAGRFISPDVAGTVGGSFASFGSIWVVESTGTCKGGSDFPSIRSVEFLDFGFE